MTDFFTYCFSSSYGFGSWLNASSLLMFAACGACVANKSGNIFLGGEGIIYLCGFVTAKVFIASSNLPAGLSFSLALIVCVITGILFCLIPAFLYEAKGAIILLSSFILSSALIPLVDGAVTSSGRTSGSNLLALPFINKNVRLSRLILPSSFNISFFIALFLCIAVYFFLYRTYSGRKIILWGTSSEFAEYSGLNRKTNSYLSMTACGILHSLTAFFAVCGTYYTCHKGFYSGMGWNALTVSLLAKSNPLSVIPASLVLSWIYTSADNFALVNNFGFDISSLLQGIILFITAFPLISKNIKWFSKSLRRNR